MTLAAEAGRPSARGIAQAPVVLDVVVPVHNEEADLGTCVHRLHEYLTTSFPYGFQITIADNASTDATLESFNPCARSHSLVSDGWTGMTLVVGAIP